MKEEKKLLGHIGVDAGLVWIGDPCYILHKTEPNKSIGSDWLGFCDAMEDKVFKSFKFNLGHEGLGVCTSTRHGDGTYPVYGIFKAGSNRPSQVVIDFDDE